MKLAAVTVFVSVAALSLLSGCATTRMQAQINALDAENKRQAQEVTELEARAHALQSQVTVDAAKKVGGDLATDSLDLAKSAWNWSADMIGASYKATSEKAHACYAAIDFSGLKTAEDYRAAAIKCWNTDSQ